MVFGAKMFLIAITFAVLACIAGRYLSRQKLLRGRQPLAMTDIVSSLPDVVVRDEAFEVLQAIGKSFGLRPEILRLDDPMSALTAIDSWRLGQGQEKLERWLRAKGVSGFQRKPATIRELILSVVAFGTNRQTGGR